MIYLDPQHGTNTVRTLTISHLMAAMIGWVLLLCFGSGYLAAGISLVMTIVLMIVLDVVHPPAVSASLSFALRAHNETHLILFFLAIAVTATLVLLERITLWILPAYDRSS
ncbi:HPP family protein [Leptolyngbya sp. ST-U4]